MHKVVFSPLLPLVDAADWVSATHKDACMFKEVRDGIMVVATTNKKILTVLVINS